MKDQIIVDGTVYTKTETESPIKIVVLQRGWVFVGQYSRVGSDCSLHKAKCIRVWGTTKGLGEIAAGGPIPGKTILDPFPTVSFDILTAVVIIDCAEDKWAGML